MQLSAPNVFLTSLCALDITYPCLAMIHKDERLLFSEKVGFLSKDTCYYLLHTSYLRIIKRRII